MRHLEQAHSGVACLMPCSISAAAQFSRIAEYDNPAKVWCKIRADYFSHRNIVEHEGEIESTSTRWFIANAEDASRSRIIRLTALTCRRENAVQSKNTTCLHTFTNGSRGLKPLRKKSVHIHER